MSSHLTFSLQPQQVPKPPADKDPANQLRWLVMVMDPYDPELGFVAGALSQALKFNEISPKQWGRLQYAFDRIRRAYASDTLICQQINPPPLER